VTPEETYELQPEPDVKIDDLISDAVQKVEKVQGIVKGYERCDDVEELHSMLSEVEYYLGELVGYRKSGTLEDIEKQVDKFRAWGSEWRTLAEEFAPIPSKQVEIIEARDGLVTPVESKPIDLF